MPKRFVYIMAMYMGLKKGLDWANKVRDKKSKHFLNESQIIILNPGSWVQIPSWPIIVSQNLCSSYLLEMSKLQTSAELGPPMKMNKNRLLQLLPSSFLGWIDIEKILHF